MGKIADRIVAKNTKLCSSEKSLQKVFPGLQIRWASNVRVTNPYSGESIVLTAEEFAVYEYTKRCELKDDWSGLDKGLNWFIENNLEAYMTLLD